MVRCHIYELTHAQQNMTSDHIAAAAFKDDLLGETELVRYLLGRAVMQKEAIGTPGGARTKLIESIM